jgi:alpha-tubulin suppressor-like RCC1 family protein
VKPVKTLSTPSPAGPGRGLVPGLGAATFVLLLTACRGSLVDGNAPADLVNPSCQAQQIVCAGVCIAEDAAHCGSSCADCSGATFSDPHAVPACVAHACGMACDPGFLRSGQSCRRAVAVTAGFAHTCALLEGGAVACWGANEHGQVGDGTTQDRYSPVEVALPGPASAVAAGYVHTCAAVSGDVYCWGDDAVGELGPAARADTSRPGQVPGISGVTALSAGGGENAGTPRTFYGHTCALTGGTVWCWGADESGQLGDGAFQVSRPTPAPVGGLGSGATAVAVGDRHSCAVVAGAVQCWGADAAGQLGDGGSQNQSAPRQAVAAGALAVAAGSSHSCAVVGPAGSEALSCWGDNSSGQVAGGVNTPALERTPLQPDLGFPFHPTGVAAGNAHTCAFTRGAAGPVCFGSDASAELGLPPAPRGLNVLSLPSVQALAAGYHHGCALLGDGSLRCWGDDTWGQLGNGTAGGNVSTPVIVSGE